MDVIVLLLVLSHMDGNYESTTSISIRGFQTISECRLKLSSLVRSVPGDLEIKMARCSQPFGWQPGLGV